MVYNPHHIQLQQKLWKKLTQVTKLNNPWILLGDFNAITSPIEHKGSSFTYYAIKALSFSNFISGNSLIDVSYSGASFSWSNGQRDLARHWSRLDRCLVNDIWLANSNTIHLKCLRKIFLDQNFS